MPAAVDHSDLGFQPSATPTSPASSSAHDDLGFVPAVSAGSAGSDSEPGFWSGVGTGMVAPLKQLDWSQLWKQPGNPVAVAAPMALNALKSLVWDPPFSDDKLAAGKEQAHRVANGQSPLTSNQWGQTAGGVVDAGLMAGAGEIPLPEGDLWGGLKAAAPDVGAGTAKAAAGYALRHVPDVGGMGEMMGLYKGGPQIWQGLKKGWEAFRGPEYGPPTMPKGYKIPKPPSPPSHVTPEFGGLDQPAPTGGNVPPPPGRTIPGFPEDMVPAPPVIGSADIVDTNTLPRKAQAPAPVPTSSSTSTIAHPPFADPLESQIIGEGQQPVRAHETNTRVANAIENKISNLSEYLRSKGGDATHLDQIIADPKLAEQFQAEGRAYGAAKGTPVPKKYNPIDPGSDTHLAIRQRILDLIEQEKNKQ